jgi:8-oxo-dGTP diphosphatase
MPVTDQGLNQERYMLVPRTLIFLTRGERILLIKGAHNKRLWANLYNGIGGHVEPGEDVLSAAYRELIEETNLIPDELLLCATVTIDTGQNPGIVLFVLRGECTQGEPISSHEGKPEWVSINQLTMLPLVEDLPILLEHILAMRKGEPPLAAHYFYDASGKMIVMFYR